MAIIGLQRRLHEAGRIRIGAAEPTSNGKRRPVKLAQFRFTSRNRRAIEAVAATYGGECRPWADAPGGEQWEVFTTAAEIPVTVPPEQMSFSQHYETWSGGGCQRRCDGEHDSISDGPCLCDPDARECKPHTRLSLMLAAYPGTGLWRLDTSGYYAATELGGAMEVAAMLTATVGRAVLPGTLRIEHRTVKRPNKPPNNFSVPVLDFSVDMSALATGTAAAIAGVPVAIAAPHAAALPAASLTPVPVDDTPVPSLTEQLAAVEADPATTKRRANAAPPVASSGRRPRPAAQVDDEGPGGATTVAVPPATSTQDTPVDPPAASSPAPRSSSRRGTRSTQTDEARAQAPSSAPAWCRDLHTRATAIGLDELQFRAVVGFATNGRTTSTAEMKPAEAAYCNATLSEIEASELVLTPQPDGSYVVDPKF